jgi:hypothetical protein
MTRSYWGPLGLRMADTDIPNRFWPALRLVINNLWWMLALVALERAGEHDDGTALVFGALALVNIAVAAQWGFLADLLKTAKGRRAVGLGLIVAGILMVAAGTYLLASQQTASVAAVATAPAPAIELVINQQITGRVFTGNPGPQEAVRYNARFNFTGNNLRAVLQFRAKGTRGSYNQLVIKEFKNVLRNDDLSIQIVSRTDMPDRRYAFWWGDPEKQISLKIGSYEARLMLFRDDDDHNAQYYYFMIVPGLINNIVYPDAISANTLEFAKQWP